MCGQLPQIEYFRASVREEFMQDLVDRGFRVERLPERSTLGEEFCCSLGDAEVPLWFDRDVSSPDHFFVLIGDAPFWSWPWRRGDYAALFTELDRILDVHALPFISTS